MKLFLLFLLCAGLLSGLKGETVAEPSIAFGETSDELVGKLIEPEKSDDGFGEENADEEEEDVEDEEDEEVKDFNAFSYSTPVNSEGVTEDENEDDEIIKDIRSTDSHDPLFFPRIPNPIPRLPRIPNPIPRIPNPIPRIPNPIPRIPNPFRKIVRSVKRVGGKVVRHTAGTFKAIPGEFKKIKQVVPAITGAVTSIDWKQIGNTLGKAALETFKFLNCVFPEISDLLHGCGRDIANSAQSCVRGKQHCGISFGGRHSKCLRISISRNFRKSYGPVTFTGRAWAQMGVGLSIFFNSGKIRAQLYGSVNVQPTARIFFAKSRSKTWKKRIALKKAIQIFKKVVTIVIGQVPVPVIIEVTAQPVARMKVTGNIRGSFDARLTLHRPARVALDHLTVEYDPKVGKPTISAAASQNLDNLVHNLKPTLKLRAHASITAVLQVGVELVFKINGIPTKTFPNFEMKLAGSVTGIATNNRACVRGSLNLSTRLNVLVVPDVQSLTSVADNFNAGCMQMVDNLCKLNPGTRVLGCISSKADVCQHARNGCLEMSRQLAKIPNPLQSNPLMKSFQLFRGPNFKVQGSKCAGIPVPPIRRLLPDLRRLFG